jgi:SNF2 family DNA or RNA helicase
LGSGRNLVKSELWKHQREDADKLEGQARVLCANGMGTGKTLFAIERDLRLREDAYEGPTLVVAPLNTHESWLETYQRETDLKVKRINRKNRDWFLKPPYQDVYIMHYEALRLMPDLRDFGFGHGIFDECHKLKGRKSRMTKAAKKLSIPYLTDMSGSPATDRPQDLWSILNHLKPKTYSSFWKFFEEYVDYEVQYPQGYRKTVGPADNWYKKGLPAIQPFYTRRLKEDVLENLPSKIYHKIYVDLSPTQRRIYNEMRDEMITWIEDKEAQGEMALAAPAVIAQLQRLQMIAIGTPYFNDVGKIGLTDPSSKVDAVIEILQENESEQFVVFSQFKQPLKILKNRLDKERLTYGSFTGDDPQRFREIHKREFIAGKRQHLLGTIGSGGVGVDGLQHAACNVIFIDRNWSPMLNEQAEDRLHRGGQTKVVNVIDIMARDTVDYGRLQRIELKGKLIKEMLQGRMTING